MGIFDWILRAILFFWLGAFGIGFADLAVQLQSEAIKAYQKGPLSASKFTQMMTGENKK
ncbi:MAG: hypothetical protein SGJ18_15160 [Pseudomonadota bacterium]|nr:hypothetical protein [Pseudomonadota bacterium]